MNKFKTIIENDKLEHNFECYENTEPIAIGDSYLFFFAQTACIGVCNSENEKLEINPNDRVKNMDIIDLVTGFWKNCYKIKTTDFDINTLY